MDGSIKKLKEKSKIRQAVIPLLTGIVSEIRKENNELKRFVLEAIKAIIESTTDIKKVHIDNLPKQEKPVVNVETKEVKVTEKKVKFPEVQKIEGKVKVEEIKALKDSVDSLTDKIEKNKPIKSVDVKNLPIIKFLNKQNKKEVAVPVKLMNRIEFESAGAARSGSKNVEALLKNTQADTKLLSKEVTLTAIKDTDGIKKIQDELPAGTQDIGKIRLTDGVRTVGTTRDGDGGGVNVFGTIGLNTSSVLYAFADTQNTLPVRMDPVTHSLQTIEYEHAEVHGGSHFTFAAYNADLDLDGTLEFIITTPNTTKWGHLMWEITGALTTLVELFESTTHTTNVQQTVYNNDRNSATTATITIHTSNNDGANGTRIDVASFGVDTGIGATLRSGGGSSRGGQEWILKQNTKYLVKITSGTDNNNVNLRLSWYEHTNLT